MCLTLFDSLDTHSTECGAITYTYGEHDDGEITAGVEIKLEDYMDYKTTDKPYPRGEILVRSKTGAHGYLNRPDLTAKSWSKDGFFHTGTLFSLSLTHIPAHTHTHTHTHTQVISVR